MDSDLEKYLGDSSRGFRKPGGNRLHGSFRLLASGS
jgi:hypothetical protein